jgi:hypothetical protein
VDEATLERLRQMCLVLPEAVEADDSVGKPVFKVRGKVFAMQHAADGRPSLWCKAEKGFQPVLVGSNPARFFVPPYVGVHGWVGIWLDVEQDWDEIGDLVETSYRMTAPKRLSKLIEP